MSQVYAHAAPKPITKTQSVHDCHVGSGSYAAWYRSKAYAAATETASCESSIHPIRMDEV
ncbi:hypothetical protein UFOVP1020_28 [uncultured Caudovirales phage]|uniref:Uncharacterized protein n=1 Tax=uncultured Caudovirales phage TaxID=2100421 RepID=A0A6J5Q8H0_9CAUD|nr:hypothetical protein UFOVP512_33 [uncultured Caudovirales phage]CAB4178687.1 hypothetical protein UFOVP1020_28 [uncultured Caudovirales phage]CAB4187965.1 hypothetical protein UFOVP1170_23 [uncultured Caudovirales phage]CAB4220369.1 hypothetical protein UFOVP1621_22 [uncultured Caudovirales phage]